MYLYPKATFDELFPSVEKCFFCKSESKIEGPQDLAHEARYSYLGMDSSFSHYALSWRCPACKASNTFTENDSYLRVWENWYPSKEYISSQRWKRFWIWFWSILFLGILVALLISELF